MMSFDECMDFVNSYSKSGKPVTDLSRAKHLMKLAGNPQNRLDFIHVAGTNGKGSTVESIQAIKSGSLHRLLYCTILTEYA